MAFRVSALPLDEFQDLFALSNEELRQRGATRCVADHAPGFPCRVSLRDAAPGETVILLPYAHQPADSPFRAAGPVFVREDAVQAVPAVNEVPGLLRLRSLSVRAYSQSAMMIDAALVEGAELEPAVERLFANPRAEYLHVHYAAPGCYACRIDRVSASC